MLTTLTSTPATVPSQLSVAVSTVGATMADGQFTVLEASAGTTGFSVSLTVTLKEQVLATPP